MTIQKLIYDFLLRSFAERERVATLPEPVLETPLKRTDETVINNECSVRILDAQEVYFGACASSPTFSNATGVRTERLDDI